MRTFSPLLLLTIPLVSAALLFPIRLGLGAPLPKRLLMAVMGDSMTAASLADVPIPYADTPEDQVRKWAEQGKDSRFIFENKFTLSWASGRAIDSHYKRLKRWLKGHGEKRPLDVLNVAFPGDTTYDLEGQAKQIVEAMDSGQYQAIKYLPILIGSNDACTSQTPIGTPLEAMHDNLKRALEILSMIHQSEPLRVILVGIPRIPDLGTKAFRNASTLFGLSCETVRNKILNFCNPLLLWNTPEEYGEKMQIVEDKNRLLRNFVQEANTRFPNIEMVYSNRLYNLAIPIQVLAADCFHPGKIAQSRISEEIWMDQPWFN